MAINSLGRVGFVKNGRAIGAAGYYNQPRIKTTFEFDGTTCVAFVLVFDENQEQTGSYNYDVTPLLNAAGALTDMATAFAHVEAAVVNLLNTLNDDLVVEIPA